MSRLFYPAWWLKATGYFDSHINTGPDVIMFEPSPYSNNNGGNSWLIALFLTAVLSSALTLTISHLLVTRNKQTWSGHVYIPSTTAEEERAPIAMSVHTVQTPVMPFSLSSSGSRRRDYIAINV